MQHLVTKQSLTDLINNSDKEKQMKIVGRALVAILANQTAEEQSAEQTIEHNEVGFTGTDGNFGTRTAKFYAQHGYLGDFAMRYWLQQNKSGIRITKYWRQLNNIANKKQLAGVKITNGQSSGSEVSSKTSGSHL